MKNGIALGAFLIIAILMSALTGTTALAKPTDSPAKITQWRDRLYSDDSNVRSMAVQALLDAELPQAAAAIQEALRDKQHQDARLTILKGVELKDDDRFIREIILLLDDRDSKVAEAAASALSSRRSQQAIGVMVEELNNPQLSALVRSKLARTLAEMRELKAVPVLIEMLSAQEEPVRIAAHDSLAAITMRSFGFDKTAWAGWWEIWKERPREMLLEDVIQLQDRKIRQISGLTGELWVKLLGLQDLGKDPRLLQEALNSDFPDAKVFAAKKIAETKPAGAADMLIAQLGYSDSQVRQAVAAALGEIGDRKAVQPLTKALTDPDSRVAAEAAAALGRIKAPEAVSALLQLLRSGKTEAATAAARALGDTGDARAVEPLSAVLRNSKLERGVREEAASALGKIPNGGGLAALVVALADPDGRIRWTVADSLGRLGLPAAVASLGKTITSDKDPLVREVAALSLGRIKAPEAIQYLLVGMDDVERRVSDQSLTVLATIIGANVNSYAVLAGEMMRRNENTKVVRLCQAAVDRIAKQDPAADVTPLNRALVSALAAMKRWTDARGTLEQLARANPTDKGLQEKLLVCYVELGEHEAAVAQARSAMKQFPADTAGWSALVLSSLDALTQSQKTDVVLAFMNDISPETFQALPEERRKQLTSLKERCAPEAPPAPVPTVPAASEAGGAGAARTDTGPLERPAETPVTNGKK